MVGHTRRGVSEENVEIMRRVFRLANEGDLESVAAAYSEDAALYGPDDWPEPGPWHGRAAILVELRRLWEDFEGDLVIEDIAAHGDWVLVGHRWRVRGSRSGVPGAFQITLAAHLRDGEVDVARYFWRHEDALKAAGVAG
jgi:ketosteroid isomerase-like protein